MFRCSSSSCFSVPDLWCYCRFLLCALIAKPVRAASIFSGSSRAWPIVFFIQPLVQLWVTSDIADIFGIRSDDPCWASGMVVFGFDRIRVSDAAAERLSRGYVLGAVL